MAHYAKINKTTRLVETVIVADRDFISTLDDFEDWIQTSYNTREGVHLTGGVPLRKNFAGIGYTYDHIRDAFIPPKQFNSWILDENKCIWIAPVEKPEGDYMWNEEEQNWVIADSNSYYKED
jgi:hypothetical protein